LIQLKHSDGFVTVLASWPRRTMSTSAQLFDCYCLIGQVHMLVEWWWPVVKLAWSSRHYLFSSSSSVHCRSRTCQACSLSGYSLSQSVFSDASSTVAGNYTCHLRHLQTIIEMLEGISLVYISDATFISCCSKTQNGLTFWYWPAAPSCPGNWMLNSRTHSLDPLTSDGS